VFGFPLIHPHVTGARDSLRTPRANNHISRRLSHLQVHGRVATRSELRTPPRDNLSSALYSSRAPLCTLAQRKLHTNFQPRIVRRTFPALPTTQPSRGLSRITHACRSSARTPPQIRLHFAHFPGHTYHRTPPAFVVPQLATGCTSQCTPLAHSVPCAAPLAAQQLTAHRTPTTHNIHLRPRAHDSPPCAPLHPTSLIPRHPPLNSLLARFLDHRTRLPQFPGPHRPYPHIASPIPPLTLQIPASDPPSEHHSHLTTRKTAQIQGMSARKRLIFQVVTNPMRQQSDSNATSMRPQWALCPCVVQKQSAKWHCRRRRTSMSGACSGSPANSLARAMYMGCVALRSACVRNDSMCRLHTR